MFIRVRVLGVDDLMNGAVVGAKEDIFACIDLGMIDLRGTSNVIQKLRFILNSSRSYKWAQIFKETGAQIIQLQFIRASI